MLYRLAFTLMLLILLISSSEAQLVQEWRPNAVKVYKPKFAMVLLRRTQHSPIMRSYSDFSRLSLQSYRPEELPIFCKAEHLILKQSGVNFRFRLGSVDYVDYLEQK